MVILKLKNKFDCYKNPHVLNDVSVDNILISKKISSAQKKKKKKKKSLSAMQMNTKLNHSI